MEKYDYLSAVVKDIQRYLEENPDAAELDAEELHNRLWVEDSVTGNASGSYTFSQWQAEENLCHNKEFLDDIAFEYGNDDIYRHSPEVQDVCIRCYLLSQAIEIVRNGYPF